MSIRLLQGRQHFGCVEGEVAPCIRLCVLSNKGHLCLFPLLCTHDGAQYVQHEDQSRKGQFGFFWGLSLNIHVEKMGAY